MQTLADLDRLTELGDPSFVDEMVELFAELSAQQMVDLRDALVLVDAASLGAQAHKLRGACLGMFATEMGALLESLEESGRSGQLAAALAVFAQLEDVHARTVLRMREVARAVAGGALTPSRA